MKVGARQEHLELLTTSLQEHLRAEIPSGEFFQVKCAVTNNRLMILIQRPQGVTVDTEKVFAVTEEALNSLSATEEKQVEVFLRIAGQQLPYAKRELVAGKHTIPEVIDVKVNEERIVDDEALPDSPSIDDSYANAQGSWVPSPTEKDGEEDFDPLADAPDLTYYSTVKHFYPIKLMVVGGGFVAIAMFALGAYLVTRPCVLSQCQPIQLATELQKPALPLVSQGIPTAELTKLQTEIDRAIASLQQIPPWSSRHQEVEPLVKKLSAQKEEVNLLLKAFQFAQQAAQKPLSSKNNLQELQANQQLWRQAISPLEAIDRKSPFYDLVNSKLSSYRYQLQLANQQLRTQDKWLQKLASAKSVAIAAQKRQETAKFLPELQKTQSTWEVAVNALKIIPPTSVAYADAQQLLLEYKPKLANASLNTAKEQMADKTYNQATDAAKQAQLYETQNQWQNAVGQWSQAIRAIKQVSQDSSYYSKAQPLLAPYNSALQKAQSQFQADNQLQTTRTDLTKTCVNGGVAICNFTVNLDKISVRMTSEYEQAIAKSNQNNSNSTTNHLQVLQQALEVISDNAGIPLAIYDAQGSQFYQYTPRG
jgi:heat shock protein HspQ